MENTKENKTLKEEKCSEEIITEEKRKKEKYYYIIDRIISGCTFLGLILLLLALAIIIKENDNPIVSLIISLTAAITTLFYEINEWLEYFGKKKWQMDSINTIIIICIFIVSLVMLLLVNKSNIGDNWSNNISSVILIIFIILTNFRDKIRK